MADVVETLNQDTMEEQRTRVTPTGWVDCFICGHRVLVTRALGIEKTHDGMTVGPKLFAHPDCASIHVEKLDFLYMNAIRGVVGSLHCANLGHATPEEYHRGL